MSSTTFFEIAARYEKDSLIQKSAAKKRSMIVVEERFFSAQRYESFTGHKNERNLALYGYRKHAEKPQGNYVILYCMKKRKPR